MTETEEFSSDHRMPPIGIVIMMACYFSPSPEDVVGIGTWRSDAGKSIRAQLMAEDLIDADDHATERGKAWVEFICTTPLPVMRWAMPERQS